MTWKPPTLVVRVALAMGPNDEPGAPESGNWTDLSSRVKGVARGKRGRSDPLSPFQPGTVSITLDNTDRMLDPLNPDGLVYFGAGNGLPMCPVTVDWLVNGVEYRKFTGFLGPECWPATTGARGAPGTVELQAMDLMGYSPDLPSDAWGAYTMASAPDWWLRMDGGFPVVADGSTIPNRSGTGGGAIAVCPSGISRYVNDGSFTSPLPQVRMAADSSFVSVSADVMPDGDELNLTVSCFFNIYGPLPTGDSVRILSMVEPGGGNLRWEITVNDAGEAWATTYDAAGAQIATAMVDAPFSWDQIWTPLIVRFSSGNNMDVWMGGYTLVGGTLTATSTVYESDLICGPGDVDMGYDEVTLWRRAWTDDDVAGSVLATGGLAQPWHGDKWLDRLGHWYQATGRSVGPDQTEQWHMPFGDEDDGLFGIGSGDGVPENLTQAMEITASWSGGSAWVTKRGYWRVRSLDALTHEDYEDEYQITKAIFTDDDAIDLDGGEYRHAGVTPIGSTVDTVINRVEMPFYVRRNPPSDPRSQAFYVAPQDDASVARFGLRSDRVTNASEWWNWATNAAVADKRLARYAWPYAGINTVNLDATGDADLTLWLADTLELEIAVDVAYTPFGGDKVTFEGLNVQAEDWTLTGETLTATLTVARS